MINRVMPDLANTILALPRALKRIVALTVDMALCVLTVWLAYYLRIGEFVALSGPASWAAGASIVIALPIFIVSGLYRAIFRYSGLPAMLAIARAAGIYAVLYASIFTVVGVSGVPRTVGIIQPILLLLFVGASRVIARVWLGDRYSSLIQQYSRPKVLIYGAGRAGRRFAAAIANSAELQLVGFLDDDKALQGRLLNGQPIYNPENLEYLAEKLDVSEILLAMPSLSRRQRTEIISKISNACVVVRKLPSVIDLAQGKVTLSDMRELDIDDLLGRELVAPNPVLLKTNIFDKVVLVTGAGGSIGSELCRQIVAVGPAKLLLVEKSEFALYAIHQELEQRLRGRKTDSSTVLIPLLASVQDGKRMQDIMSAWRPNTVYHAAAYKHVPLVEQNLTVGIKNNVLGTVRTAQAAVASGVSNFVLISTDKAVRPTNVMGASKRLAEMALQALAATGVATNFSMVRFGNVLGSSGSVVPRFLEQIRGGGPVTLTHPEVTRYFMSIREAAQLVIQAGAMASGGEVFLLDMGQAVKIIDLARRMVDLSGLTLKDEQNPDGDIEIEVTGLRPGEKLYEELLIGENPEGTEHPRILKAREDFLPWSEFEERLKALEIAVAECDILGIHLMMQESVVGYTPSEIVDWLHVEKEAEMRAKGTEL